MQKEDFPGKEDSSLRLTAFRALVEVTKEHQCARWVFGSISEVCQSLASQEKSHRCQLASLLGYVEISFV